MPLQEKEEMPDIYFSPLSHTHSLSLSLCICAERRPCENTARRFYLPAKEVGLTTNHPCHLGLGLPASRTIRKYTSAVQPSRGVLLWQCPFLHQEKDVRLLSFSIEGHGCPPASTEAGPSGGDWRRGGYVSEPTAL